MSTPSSAKIPATIEEWSAILEKVELTVRAPYSKREKLLLWCQGVIVLLSGILYLISLLRQAATKSFWCIKKDLDGYWRPNVHVAIPILTITHAATQATAIGLTVIGDAEGDKATVVVALNLVACSVLYFAGWTKIWAVLYALPSSIFRLRRRDVLGSTAMITKRRILLPKSFNYFILSGYVAGFFSIPALSYTVHWVQQIINRLRGVQAILKEIILLMTLNPQDISPRLLLALQVRSEAQRLELAQSEALKFLRIFSGIWLAVSFGALVIFLGGSFALMLALTRQIEILGKIQKQREMLIGRMSYISMSKPPIHPLKNKQIKIQSAKSFEKSLIYRFKTWLPSLGDGDEEDPLATSPQTTPPDFPLAGRTGDEDLIGDNDGAKDLGKTRSKNQLSSGWNDTQNSEENSKKNKKRLTSYCVRFAWQTVFCTLISLSYIVLNSFVVFNIFDAPRSITLSQLFRTIEQWAAWSWGGGPGAVLGLLACIVAFSHNPSLPREPEKGPPVARITNMHGRYGDDDEEDEVYEKYSGFRGGGDQNSLTAEKLYIHSYPDSHAANSFPKLPQPVKACGSSGSSSWQGLRLKLGLASRSNLSRSSPSQPPPAFSETCAAVNRTWSPFQIMSLDSSNVVTMQSARPYPLNKLQKSLPRSAEHNSSTEELSLAGRKKFAYHYPTGVTPRSIGPCKMPVQITRSDQQSFESKNSLPSTPLTPKFTSQQVAGGHFDAIHQLRDR
ncbi:hypothetical protein BY996DRAFT_4589464 [Phakopsora pachyrhizi]|nr:hypothetical protein BY996DRAFT_4589464 [Phakopsora pachyrhizi]